MFLIIERHPVLTMLLLAVLMVAALYAAAAVAELVGTFAATDGTVPAEAGRRGP